MVPVGFQLWGLIFHKFPGELHGLTKVNLLFWFFIFCSKFKQLKDVLYGGLEKLPQKDGKNVFPNPLMI